MGHHSAPALTARQPAPAGAGRPRGRARAASSPRGIRRRRRAAMADKRARGDAPPQSSTLLVERHRRPKRTGGGEAKEGGCRWRAPASPAASTVASHGLEEGQQVREGEVGHEVVDAGEDVTAALAEDLDPLAPRSGGGRKRRRVAAVQSAGGRRGSGQGDRDRPRISGHRRAVGLGLTRCNFRAARRRGNPQREKNR